jgi:hypothetical protein
MATKTLFVFRFKGRLLARESEQLREATGMMIGDVENLWKDTPGKGQPTPGVYMALWRPSDVPDDWIIDATTRQDDYDHDAVEACRQRIRELLLKIAYTWEEQAPAD